MPYPQWILSRAPADCPDSERYVFEQLNKVLSEDWLILWGYFYMDNGQQREGDFLLLGPEGGVIVLEAKSVGRMLGYADRMAGDEAKGHYEDPATQIRAQWDAIRRELMGLATDLRMKSGDFIHEPWIASVLCIHNATREQVEYCAPHIAGLDSIMGKDDLQNFPAFYARIAKIHSRFHTKASREVFLASRFGRIGAPRTIRHLCDFIEGDMERLCQASFSTLDALQENQRFLIHGSSGSGKTWLLLRQALHWAEQPDAKVLLLCYNQSLANYFSQLLSAMSRQKSFGDAASRIHVHTWESLMKELFLGCGLGWEEIYPSEEARRKGGESAMRTHPFLLSTSLSVLDEKRAGSRYRGRWLSS